MEIPKNYRLSDFDYHLPDNLIAYYPQHKRDHSKLLVVNHDTHANCFDDVHFYDLLKYINSNDLLIVNDSKVIKARLFGSKITGGRVEILVERIISDKCILVHLRTSKTIKLGLVVILLDDNIALEVTQINGDGLFVMSLSPGIKVDWLNYLEKYGHIPLPPYIDRLDELSDSDYYQTVYAKVDGSVAAPTAGLHFSDDLIEQIKQRHINIESVTLHVGYGTFKTVDTDDISLHKMHHEFYSVSEKTVDAIKQCKARGGRVIAIGTTTLRVLETLALNDFSVLTGETNIFITPGFDFRVVDILVTNFHLPKSTLLMLVSAFAGYQTIRLAYQHAIEHNYKFFSYGDAMLLYCNH